MRGQQFLHTGDGVMPGLVDAFGAVVEVDGVGDQQHRAVHVVVDGHVRDKVQCQFGKLQVILGRAGELLPVADRFPAKEAHQAGGERRKPVEPGGAQRLDGVANRINRVSVHRHTRRRFAQPVRLSVLGGQRGAGPGTNEGVAGPGTADSRRLHEERARLALRQLPVQPDRRFGVRQHLEPDRDDAAVGGEFPEFFQARADDSEVLHRYWFSVCSWLMPGCKGLLGVRACWAKGPAGWKRRAASWPDLPQRRGPGRQSRSVYRCGMLPPPGPPARGGRRRRSPGPRT
jgi:hypothetical protein